MSKILVLGGTQFIGRVLIEHLQKTDNNITLFNRGKKNPTLFPEYRKIVGDRETDEIKQIYNEDWDIVFDFSAYYPLTLEKLVNGLKGKVGRYIFVSTISVYDLEKYANQNITEELEIFPCFESEKTDKTMETYGQRKAECERVLLSKEWLDTVIFRPSIVYGKYDYTDRFYYWLYRVMTQKQILVPQNETKGNYTFVDDLAELMIEAMSMTKPHKVYNSTTHDPLSIKEILQVSMKVSGQNPELIYASDSFLEENNVKPWNDLPFWIHDNMIIDHSKIKQDFKFTLTPFEDSISKTIDYNNSIGWAEGKYGLSVLKERDLISQYFSNKLIMENKNGKS